IIMVRLQRVTFLALYNYLGLTTELFNPESQAIPLLSVASVASGRAKRQMSCGLEERLEKLPRSLESCDSVPLPSTHREIADELRQSQGSCPDPSATQEGHEGATSDLGMAYDRARVMPHSDEHLGNFLASKSKKNVIVAETPSAIFHYSESPWDETGVSEKTDAIFRAAKKDLLTLMKLDDPSLLDDRVA
uniref:Uncharacterized protein n=1 Tax=Nannospalax galili TaxID=1026970 RepID=A0A8C6QNA2_NANGA